MTLTIYGFHKHPAAFAVTKVGAPQEECSYLLDFARLLQPVRWLGMVNNWMGRTVGYRVPIIHVGEKVGGFAVWVSRTDPYFGNLPRLWKEHRGSNRTLSVSPADGLQIIADFGKHFPSDAALPPG